MALINTYQGAHLRLLANSTTTFTSAGGAKAYAPLSESMARQQEVLNTRGMRGTRLHHVHSARLGPSMCSGTIVLPAINYELDDWFPRLWSAAGTKSTNTWPFSESPDMFNMLIDRGSRAAGGAADYLISQFADCYCTRWSLSGSNRQPYVNLSMDVLAASETVNSTWPSGAPTIYDGNTAGEVPYTFADSVLVLDGVTVPCYSWELSVDHAVQMEHTSGALVPTHVRATDCRVTLTVDFPLEGGDVFHSTVYADSNGIFPSTNTLTLTRTGNLWTKFTFANLTARPAMPTVQQRGPIAMRVVFEAVSTDSAHAMVVENDITP